MGRGEDNEKKKKKHQNGKLTLITTDEKRKP